VLESRTFARAEKLQKFLRYVCELTFRGDAALVHEHLIAIEVFGRGIRVLSRRGFGRSAPGPRTSPQTQGLLRE
jgi:hypothetical protein